MFRVSALVVALAVPVAASADDPPKAIAEAIKALEKARADAKDPAEKEKLADAVAALKKVSDAKKPANHLISDFIDNPETYTGRTLTFRVTYTGGRALNLTQPGAQTTFKGEDSKNGAKINLAVYLPRASDIKLPAAKEGDELVVTFKVLDKGTHHLVAVARP